MVGLSSSSLGLTCSGGASTSGLVLLFSPVITLNYSHRFDLLVVFLIFHELVRLGTPEESELRFIMLWERDIDTYPTHNTE